MIRVSTRPTFAATRTAVSAAPAAAPRRFRTNRRQPRSLSSAAAARGVPAREAPRAIAGRKALEPSRVSESAGRTERDARASRSVPPADRRGNRVEVLQLRRRQHDVRRGHVVFEVLDPLRARDRHARGRPARAPRRARSARARHRGARQRRARPRRCAGWPRPPPARTAAASTGSPPRQSARPARSHPSGIPGQAARTPRRRRRARRTRGRRPRGSRASRATAPTGPPRPGGCARHARDPRPTPRRSRGRAPCPAATSAAIAPHVSSTGTFGSMRCR